MGYLMGVSVNVSHPRCSSALLCFHSLYHFHLNVTTGTPILSLSDDKRVNWFGKWAVLCRPPVCLPTFIMSVPIGCQGGLYPPKPNLRLITSLGNLFLFPVCQQQIHTHTQKKCISQTSSSPLGYDAKPLYSVITACCPVTFLLFSSAFSRKQYKGCCISSDHILTHKDYMSHGWGDLKVVLGLSAIQETSVGGKK